MKINGGQKYIRWIGAVVIIALTLSLCSCAYVNIKTPFDTNLDKTELGTKKGVAQAYSILWLFSWGDTSYATAAKNGGITVIRHADQEIQQVLFGLYTRWRIVVYGD
jgi:hypothetical protein